LTTLKHFPCTKNKFNIVLKVAFMFLNTENAIIIIHFSHRKTN